MDRIVLRSPPVLDRSDGGGLLMSTLPVLGSLGSIGLVATMAGGPRQYAGLGLFVAAAVLVAVLQVERQRRQRSRSVDAARRDYAAHLADARAQFRRAAAAGRAEAVARHPPPSALAALAEGDAWRPRADLEVRYGVSDGPLAAAPLVPDIGARADPFCAAAVRRLVAAWATSPGLPATLDLATTQVATAPAGTARALVCSAAGCRDLTVAVLAGSEAASRWEWVKWLPQAEGRAADGLGPRRLVAGTMAELAPLLPDAGHLLLVVDGVPPPPPRGRTTLLLVGDRLTADGAALPGQIDDCSVEAAEAFARRQGRRSLAIDVRRDWSPRPAAEELTVVLGTGDDGDDVVLDLKESALGGVGPHGMVIGATGSGKSELLRALVLGLALRHPPDRLNLALLDFKGGTAFDGLARLPHVSALVTNLADELDLLDRTADALTGELTRRQEVVRAAGGDRSSLPTLLVVVDEFAELLAARPELDELFVTLGRLGRGLGVHLLLASQRLDEGRWRGLESHLSYRIGLRTFTPEESRAVVGVVDAYELPPTPGLGYLRTDPRTLLRFQAPYVGTVLRRPTDPSRVLPFTAAPVDGPSPRTTTLVDAAVSAMVGRGRAHRIWLPPLERPTTLGALLPGLSVDPRRGFGVPRGTVPLGEIDRPRLQRRDVLEVDLTAGNLAVVGAAGTGRSTLLRTAVNGLALTRTPDQVTVHVLDLGGALTSLTRLPHVVALAGPGEPDLAARILRQVQAGTDRPTLLVVDDWATLRQDLPELEEQVARLATHGRARGVHLLVAAGRWTEMRGSVRDAFDGRVELRLGDPLDSEIDRRLAAAVPRDRPGRGLADGAHFLAALPTLADGSDPADAIAQHWHGATPTRLRALPTLVRLSDLPPHPGIRLGIREGDHAPHVLPDRGHLVVLGDAGSGRTTLLRTVLREVARVGSRDDVVLVDPRGTSGDLGLPALTHVTGDAEPAVRDLAATLSRRVGPGTKRTMWLLVDDLDLVAPGAWQPLVPLLPRAADVGLRVVVARRAGGAGRAFYEPLLGTLQELRASGLLLSGSPAEGPLLSGVSMRAFPPGRARWVDARGAAEIVQLAAADAL